MFSVQSEFFSFVLKFELENSLYCESAMKVDSLKQLIRLRLYFDCCCIHNCDDHSCLSPQLEFNIYH